jgi:hypothetical protein
MQTSSARILVDSLQNRLSKTLKFNNRLPSNLLQKAAKEKKLPKPPNLTVKNLSAVNVVDLTSVYQNTPNKPRQRLNYLSKSWITTKKMVEMPTNVRNGDPTSLLFRIDLPRRRHSSNNKKSL